MRAPLATGQHQHLGLGRALFQRHLADAVTNSLGQGLVGHRLIIAAARKKVGAIAIALQYLQLLNCEIRQVNQMRTPVLGVVPRDAPFARFQIDVRPFGVE